MPDNSDGLSLIPAPGPEVQLSNEEILRYGRHLIMPEVGMDGQKRLKAARVLLIGTGGLGAPLERPRSKRRWRRSRRPPRR